MRSNIDRLIAAGMTRQEAEVWEQVRATASSYLKLIETEPAHPMERTEICQAFHIIQTKLSMRPFMRLLE